MWFICKIIRFGFTLGIPQNCASFYSPPPAPAPLLKLFLRFLGTSQRSGNLNVIVYFLFSNYSVCFIFADLTPGNFCFYKKCLGLIDNLN